MAERFPGGVISKTPPTITAPVAGEGGSASGMWTLDTVLEYEKAGAWPKPVLPRELYAFGKNAAGQLGEGTVVNRSSPVQIGALTDWSQVSGGENHSVAIKTNGTLWAWGDNSPDGRLGDGTVIDRSSPVQIGALTNWNQVSAGTKHTAAIKTDGTLWTWGENGLGTLGDNTVTFRSSPVQIGALTTWYEVSAGGGFTAAIKTDGTLWVWGNSTNGRIGDGFVVNRSSPVQIGALTNWSKISAGYQASTAIKTDGTLWTWGQNSGTGQLGDNTVVNKSSPVQVGALTNWLQPSTGRSHTLAVKTDGTLWGWGRPTSGAIGDGTTTYRSSPVQIGALTDWAQVSAGNAHSHAVKTDGTLWSWGSNSNGQLGLNITPFTTRNSPVQVGILTTWDQVAAGDDHVLSVIKG